MSVIRTAVVGVGHLGYHHARHYAALQAGSQENKVELAGVMDTDIARAEKVAAEFGTRAIGSMRELIASGVNAVSVAVPTTHHGEVTSALLEAGIDVLVEKPIAADVAEARRMTALAAARNRLLQVGHIERFNGAVIALSHAITQPRFIECHRLSPYPSRGDDVSVVLDLMIHDIEIVLSLAQSPVLSVDAVGVSVFSGQEDIANARIRFASGCVANITASRVAAERMRKIRIFADNAYLSTDYAAQEVIVYRKKPGPVPEGVSPMEHLIVEPLPVEKEEPLKLEIASFVDCVRQRRRPVVSGEDALTALELAQQVMDFIRGHT